MVETRSGWWTGKRGEWYVVVQVLLMALVFFGPRTMPSFSPWPKPSAALWSLAGGTLLVAGGAFLLAAVFRLRRHLTPLPYPTGGATLIQTGPYALVRHPMYAGGLVLALGWALAVRGWLTLLYIAVFLVFVCVKSRREERWLLERFPGYADYQRRVRRLIPFVY